MALQQCSVLSPLLSKNHLIHNLTKEASQNSRTVWDALDVARRQEDPTLDVFFTRPGLLSNSKQIGQWRCLFEAPKGYKCEAIVYI